ncbi:MAG: hypothetical protein OEL69_09330 [Nitrosopumilus sp.]|jgi:hypothetical protein|nr:hypothetical protein [Nitrosopumilus sp.]
MSETIQTKINLGDYNKPQEQTKAVGIGKILGRIINIKDFRTNRGKPSQFTSQSAIGDDGMTDYYIIYTVESFDIKSQQVSSFFVTPAIVKQIQRVPNYQAELAAGKLFGPCKVGQKKSVKTNANYWCLLFPGEEGY